MEQLPARQNSLQTAMAQSEEPLQISASGAMTQVVTDVNLGHLGFLARLRDGDATIMGLAAGNLLMRCGGSNNCLYQSTCIFCGQKEGVPFTPPVGAACPLEISYLAFIYDGYRKAVCPEGTDFPLMMLLKDLCALELKIMRAERLMSTDGAMIELVAVGVDKQTGTLIHRPDVSAKLLAWKNAFREKLRLMEQMGLTPKAKAAIGSTMSKDPSTYVAEIMSSFREVMRKKQQDEQEAKHGTIRPAVPGDQRLLPEPVGDIIDVESGTEGCGAVDEHDVEHNAQELGDDQSGDSGISSGERLPEAISGGWEAGESVVVRDVGNNGGFDESDGCRSQEGQEAAADDEFANGSTDAPPF